jgi:SAM-dependent methyltransferase
VQSAIDRLRARSRETRVAPAVPMNSLQISTRDRFLRKCGDGTYATIEVPCLCGAEGGLVVAELDRYGLASPSIVCQECGIVRTSPRLTDESLAAFYASEYRPLYDGAVEAKDNVLRLQRNRGLTISRFLSGLLPADSRVVDLGCGAGWTLLAFRDAGHRVAGCDLGAGYLEAGRAQGLDLRHGDYTALQDVAPFDLVILSHVFEHLSDPRTLMQQIKPMLAPGGLVYIEVPGLAEIPTAYGDPLRYFQNAHLWSFDLGSLTAVMSTCGYRRVKGTGYVRSVFTPDDAIKPIDDRGGYERALRALSKAESTRPLSELLLKSKEIVRKAIGAERTSSLKNRLTGWLPQAR